MLTQNKVFTPNLRQYVIRSINIFKYSWATFLILAIIPFVLANLFSYKLLGPFAILPQLIIELLTAIVFTIVADKVINGESIELLTAYKYSLKYFVAFSWTSFLYFIRVFLFPSVLTIFYGYSGVFPLPIMFTLYFPLIIYLVIVIGWLWGVRWFFGPFLVVVRGVRGHKAISLSVALTKGNIKKIVLLQFKFLIIFFVTQGLLVGIPQILHIFEIEIPTATKIMFHINHFLGFLFRALFVIFNTVILEDLLALKLKTETITEAGSK